jgi:hypothetical protein
MPQEAGKGGLGKKGLIRKPHLWWVYSGLVRMPMDGEVTTFHVQVFRRLEVSWVYLEHSMWAILERARFGQAKSSCVYKLGRELSVTLAYPSSHSSRHGFLSIY